MNPRYWFIDVLDVLLPVKSDSTKKSSGINNKKRLEKKTPQDFGSKWKRDVWYKKGITRF